MTKKIQVNRNMQNFCSLCNVYHDNDSYTEIDEPACIS